MKSVMLCLLAAAVPGCLVFDEGDSPDGDRPPPPPDEPCPPGACSQPDPTIDLGPARRLAAGTVLRTSRVAGSWLTEVDLVSSDPSVVSVHVVNVHSMELTSHRSGTAVISARKYGTQQVLDTMTVSAVPATSIDIFYRAAPGADAPIDALAALPASNDIVCVRYLDASGEVLPGRGRFTASTAGLVLDDTPDNRLSEMFAHRSACVGARFPSSGTTSLVASVDGLSRALPISVVTAPASVSLVAMVLREGEIVVAPDPVLVGEYVGFNLVGVTATGTPVAGIGTSWEHSVLQLLVSSSTELVGKMPSAGTGTITASAGSFTRTVTVHAAPAP